MLEDRPTTCQLESLWQSLGQLAQLPEDQERFFAKKDATPSRPDSRRAHHRFYYRVRGILRVDEQYWGVYVKDISRIGLGLIAPAQLFPCATVHLTLEDRPRYPLRVVRCMRLADQCYEIGTLFDIKPS